MTLLRSVGVAMAGALALDSSAPQYQPSRLLASVTGQANSSSVMPQQEMQVPLLPYGVNTALKVPPEYAAARVAQLLDPENDVTDGAGLRKILIDHGARICFVEYRPETQNVFVAVDVPPGSAKVQKRVVDSVAAQLSTGLGMPFIAGTSEAIWNVLDAIGREALQESCGLEI